MLHDKSPCEPWNFECETVQTDVWPLSHGFLKVRPFSQTRISLENCRMAVRTTWVVDCVLGPRAAVKRRPGRESASAWKRRVAWAACAGSCCTWPRLVGCRRGSRALATTTKRGARIDLGRKRHQNLISPSIAHVRARRPHHCLLAFRSTCRGVSRTVTPRRPVSWRAAVLGSAEDQDAPGRRRHGFSSRRHSPLVSLPCLGGTPPPIRHAS